MAGLRVPLSTLRRRPCDRQRMTRGRDGWLGLSRVTLAFTTPCRFVPAHCRTSARWGFGFARGGRLHRGEQECNAEVGRYPKRRWLFWNATRRLRTELSPWNTQLTCRGGRGDSEPEKAVLPPRSGAAAGSRWEPWSPLRPCRHGLFRTRQNIDHPRRYGGLAHPRVCFGRCRQGPGGFDYH